jgi:hypothetical protein
VSVNLEMSADEAGDFFLLAGYFTTHQLSEEGIERCDHLLYDITTALESSGAFENDVTNLEKVSWAYHITRQFLTTRNALAHHSPDD